MHEVTKPQKLIKNPLGIWEEKLILLYTYTPHFSVYNYITLNFISRAVFLYKMRMLVWSKSFFGFFCNILWKKPSK